MFIIKRFICLLFIFSFMTGEVMASDSALVRIGNDFFDSLEEAIKFADSDDVINLVNDVKLSDTLDINKTVNIDLNNHNIEASEKVFLIKGGSLNLKGNGVVREKNPYYGAITLIGSDDVSKKDFSTVSVGSDVTLEGWSGIFINHNNKTAYGVLVNMNGSINALDDINGGAGAGIYINGNIQHKDNSPVINLSDTSKINSTGNGIYAAGYATYNINGAYISGIQSGLGIKSGVFNITNATIMGTGEDKTPTSGNNNGINPSGTAIQIESNSGYKGDIELSIKNSKVTSKNSNVIYEYTVKDSKTKVKDITLSSGTYISETKKDVFSLSDNFKAMHHEFISGGVYSSNPTDFLKSGFSASKRDNDLYEVISNTMSVFASKDDNSTNNGSKILFSIVVGSLVIFGIIFFKKKYII